IDEGPGRLAGSVPIDIGVDERDGVLDENGGAGRNVVVTLAFCAPDEDLVLVGDDRVADSPFEGQHRVARASVHDLHVAEDRGEQGDGGVLVTASSPCVPAYRRAVDGELVPHGSAAGTNVGSEDLDVGSRQVLPSAD